jgi:hypothetical protein
LCISTDDYDEVADEAGDLIDEGAEVLELELAEGSPLAREEALRGAVTAIQSLYMRTPLIVDSRYYNGGQF